MWIRQPNRILATELTIKIDGFHPTSNHILARGNGSPSNLLLVKWILDTWTFYDITNSSIEWYQSHYSRSDPNPERDGEGIRNWSLTTPSYSSGYRKQSSIWINTFHSSWKLILRYSRNESQMVSVHLQNWSRLRCPVVELFKMREGDKLYL
jgi:hypothetical protein